MSDWRTRAACAGLDGELFFPIGEVSVSDRRAIAAAKAVCARCPVTVECLDFALKQRCDGVYGGLTARERDVVARRGRNAFPRVDPHRVQEIAAMTRQGMTAREIGDRLGMNHQVVQRYRARAREVS
jgi:WhiB family transcriptional regulator, redox-sensing transcriptional regulator